VPELNSTIAFALNVLDVSGDFPYARAAAMLSQICRPIFVVSKFIEVFRLGDARILES